MTTIIFAFSDKGCVLAKKIAEHYSDCGCFSLPKFAKKYGMEEIENTQQKVGEVFDSSKLIIFVGAVGIAVRNIAPFIKNKATDPAVLSVDEKAQFVIPLLSGHIGGANALSRQIAQKLGAVAVVTTATDINGRFSVDEWATQNKLHISSMENAKEISAAMLVGEVQIKSDFKIIDDLPNGLTLEEKNARIEITHKDKSEGEKDKETCNLRLVPRVLTVGMGCKRDTPIKAAERLFLKALKENNLDVNAVKSIASIDIKKDEKALVALGEKYNIPFIVYTSDELLQLEGDFTKSEFVKGVTGVDNVCERSAVLSAIDKAVKINFDLKQEGELLVKKTALEGVTVAIAITNWEVRF